VPSAKPRHPATMRTRRARLFVAEDHAEVLLEMRDLLATDFEVVGTASDGLTLISAASELRPDIVVTDFAMPGLNGIDAAREMLRQGSCAAVVLFTVHSDPQLVELAIRAGIAGYVLKSNGGEDLIPAIYSALEGVSFFSPKTTEDE
jgi:DNA-binding NarL/FixJ family response regulator